MNPFALPPSGFNLPPGMSVGDEEPRPYVPEPLDEADGDEEETRAAFERHFRKCEEVIARRRREREGAAA